MVGLDPWTPEPERPRWRKRRRKWYVKLSHNLRDRVASLSWKAWAGAAVVVIAAVTLSFYNPFASTETAVQRGEPIDCLFPGQSKFAQACSVETGSSPDGRVLTVRSPDGEFRRLLIVRDGRGVIAADGAEEVSVKPAGPGMIDVKAGEIVWRLPAKVTA